MYRLEIQPVRYGVAAAKKAVTSKAPKTTNKLNSIVFTPNEFKNTISKQTRPVEKRVVRNNGDYGDTCGMSYGDWLVTGITC